MIKRSKAFISIKKIKVEIVKSVGGGGGGGKGGHRCKRKKKVSALTQLATTTLTPYMCHFI